MKTWMKVVLTQIAMNLLKCNFYILSYRESNIIFEEELGQEDFRGITLKVMNRMLKYR